MKRPPTERDKQCIREWQKKWYGKELVNDNRD